MVRKIVLILLSLIYSIEKSHSQDYFPENDGVKTSNQPYNVFINATIIVSPDKKIEKGILIERDGIVVEVGKNIEIPKNSILHDKTGQYIYPSFIDLYSNFGIRKAESSSRRGRSSQYNPNREGFYWNDHILSDYNSINDYSFDPVKSKKLREAGFGIVNAHRENGIHRGTGSLIALSDIHTDNYRIIKSKSTEFYSFKKSINSDQSYPTSVMGAMALLRQFFLDIEWYEQKSSNSKDISIEAAIQNKNLPKIFESGGRLNLMRALKIGKETNQRFTVVGSGFEYLDYKRIKSYDNTIVVPINSPKPYDVSDSELNEKLTLNHLKEWNQAPSNLSVLEENGLDFAITSKGLENISDFIKNIKKAVAYGLSEKGALMSLTKIPAKVLKMDQKIGELKKGFYANFLVASGPIFREESIIYENWVIGKQHLITPNDIVLNLDISDEDLLEYLEKAEKAGYSIEELKNIAKFNGLSSEEIKTLGQRLSNAKKELELKDEVLNKIEPKKKFPVLPVTFPNTAYGFKEKPKYSNMVFKNVTAWTNEKEGILKNVDVLISNGKIKKIGKDIETPKTHFDLDCTGKHLTAGIIDEHSHIAASSINEAGQNSSAEVSIEDVIEPDDISIFRSLAGGVTTAQILHGSANPIGGRSAIIKLRWGESDEKMIFKNSDKFIKFALGENVKQSNWGSYSRFPQTRMGVEQVFVDYFNRALEYGEKWENYNSLSKKAKGAFEKPRKDIEMDVLLEILKGKRFITCHSYVQSEINMLMKVAENFGIRINTFTHVLEGYKLAEKMSRHGVGGSTFSDWWAYKYEVIDAIPYNGPIMTEAGVTVAYNSDSSEVIRRLNQEAAKAVKYGGLSEEEAWKYVTLNPAKLLHIDDRVGSLKEGKDADLVLWSDNPLSIYASAEKTIIDGKIYYDSSKIPSIIEEMKIEKEKIIDQIKSATNGGKNLQPIESSSNKEFFCETVDN